MSARSNPSVPRRSLAVREHGAYFQLGAPLVTVLLAGRPSLAALCFAVGACIAFTAHESLLVLLGQRGGRARRDDGPRARRIFAAAAIGGLASAILGACLEPRTLPWIAVPAVLGAATLALVFRRRERTLAGELLASTTLTFAALPTAIANGLAPRVAIAVCAVFCLTSLLSTVEVRAVARRDTGGLVRILAWTTVALGLAELAVESPLCALSALPTIGTLAAIVGLRPAPRSLRRIGWALAASSLVTAGAVLVAARLVS